VDVEIHIYHKPTAKPKGRPTSQPTACQPIAHFKARLKT